MNLSRKAKLNSALLVALLFTLPLASAMHGITGSIVGSRQRIVDQEQPFYIELIDGTHEFYVTLDKPAALPIISMQISGYAVGNFTVWIEPEGGGPKLKLAESKIVQKEGVPLITGFAAKDKSEKKEAKSESKEEKKEEKAANKELKAANKDNKSPKSESIKSEKSISKRRLERLLNFLQGMLKGEAAFKARQQQQSDKGILLKPQKFKRTCSDTCSISRPMVQRRYKLTAAVDGKLEVHSLQYSVIQNS